MEYEPVEIVCICGQPFTWTVGEQEFMNQLKSEGKIQELIQPKRCEKCRAEKRARHNKK